MNLKAIYWKKSDSNWHTLYDSIHTTISKRHSCCDLQAQLPGQGGTGGRVWLPRGSRGGVFEGMELFCCPVMIMGTQVCTRAQIHRRCGQLPTNNNLINKTKETNMHKTVKTKPKQLQKPAVGELHLMLSVLHKTASVCKPTAGGGERWQWILPWCGLSDSGALRLLAF